MLRGVNKKIIEINNVDGGYFEKILFFVSDDRRSEPDSVLENQAQKYANEPLGTSTCGCSSLSTSRPRRTLLSSPSFVIICIIRGVPEW